MPTRNPIPSTKLRGPKCASHDVASKSALLRSFSKALNLQLDMHGDTLRSLLNKTAPATAGSLFHVANRWKKGKSLPRFPRSFRLLRKIERHYKLPEGHFESMLRHSETATQRAIREVNPGLQFAMREHLPRNFDKRSEKSQSEVLDWIYSNVLGGGTDFGKYQMKANLISYGLRFNKLGLKPRKLLSKGSVISGASDPKANGTYGVVDAPARLADELSNLFDAKTSIQPPRKFRRYMRWSSTTAKLHLERYAQLFGALASAPASPVMGKGVPLSKLTLGLLIFPSVWEWYLDWRHRRRGFFTLAELNLLAQAKTMSSASTGWLRQNSQLRMQLRPIRGLVTSKDISLVKRDWNAASDRLFQYAYARTPEIIRSKRAHRDPFLPIASVLHAESPLAEYKKIADEILLRMNAEKQSRPARAFSVRAYLMFRMAIHLGVRQRNLRELLLCRSDEPHSVHHLEKLGRGELSWSGSRKRWEVTIPAVAFKNRNSTFFKGGPYKLTLQDQEKLYYWINEYIKDHRPFLLGKRHDPGTFFVTASGAAGSRVEYTVLSFYATWNNIIRKYGIYNPYTRRGAIKGLLPHGPHCVRDILATHILKQTGSYELASYAIQDTVETTMLHYARFLPHEKIAQAAHVTNKFWSPEF